MGKHGNLMLLKVLLSRLDFALWTGVGMLILMSIYYWLLVQVTTFETLIANLVQEPVYLAVAVILVPAALLLFGMNFSLAIVLFRAGGRVTGQTGTLLGAFTGAFGAACPVCGAFLLSLVGVTAGLTVLPLAGLEFWIVSVAVMALALWKSMKTLARNTCDTQSQALPCWHLPSIKRLHLLVSFALVLVLLGNLYSMIARHELRMG